MHRPKKNCSNCSNCSENARKRHSVLFIALLLCKNQKTVLLYSYYPLTILATAFPRQNPFGLHRLQVAFDSPCGNPCFL